MLILFLKRLFVLGVFVMFFFFACESTEHNPTDRDTTTKAKEDDDNTGRNRSRPRSSSSRSSSRGTDGRTDGSTDGEPDGPTVIDDDCPEASEVDDHPHLTTITFYKSIDEDEGGECVGNILYTPSF